MQMTVYFNVLIFLIGFFIGFTFYYLIHKSDNDVIVKEKIRNYFLAMSPEDEDYFVTGYEDGWIKNDKVSSGLYDKITNDIVYQN